MKEALLADDPNVYFTTPHFDCFPAVLVRLERIAVGGARTSPVVIGGIVRSGSCGRR